ncbi:MAG: SEC-C domain-containing protein [Bacteroidales bacterium]|nr:SEC-C domain-containing protein [Bacteroidales bacterium]
MKENTLHSILDGFGKPELEDFANLLGQDLSPRLRKSQLVDRMDSYLHGEPERWMAHLMERDIKLLRDLVHAGPERVQYQDFADYPSLLEVTGLVAYDDTDENYHKVWISREVYDIVSPGIDKVIRSGEKSGQYELERIGLGYLNLYGILPTDRFVSLVMDWYEKTHSKSNYKALSRMLHQCPLVKMYRYTDSWGDYVCSPCVENIEEVFTLREEMKQTHFPTFSQAQAREAGCGAPYFTVGMKSVEGIRLEQMYRRVGYEGFELVKAEHDTWIEAQYTAAVNEHLFDPLLDSPRCMELDEGSWRACCEIVEQYADSVPKWSLCGRSAAQTGLFKAGWESAGKYPNNPEMQPNTSEEYPEWKMPEPTVSEGFAKDIGGDYFPMGFAIPHVAPDDPCPCGSGLKYCRCHGKYLS